MKVELVAIQELTPAKYNPRFISDGQLAALKKGLQKYGFVEPVVVNRRGNVIVGGHQRVRAWSELGRKSVPVFYVDLDEANEKALNLALNKISGEWDEDLLSQVVRDLQGLEFEDFALTGFSDDELASFGGLGNLTVNKPKPDPDQVPEPPKTPLSREGDIYQIGLHRLICGDHGDLQTIKRLMGDQRADLLLTDPPYNIGSDRKISGHGKGAKKNTTTERLMASKWDKHFNPEAMLNNVSTVLGDTCSVYIFASHFLAGLYWEWMGRVLDWYHFATWAKPNPAPSMGKRHWTSSAELLCHGTRGKHTFNFPDEGHALNVFTFNKPAKCDLHPTMKPVELIEHLITHSSKANDIILDVCGGSGSTMVAAERTNRQAMMVEGDPIHVDTIVMRMKANFPELEITRNGKPFK